ncbi:MAG: ATP-binding cassette domain-containing protein [Candidatus Njordarchaeia archaeon]
MNRELLEIKNLWARIGERDVLRGINLRIGKGELHVLLGPNATGKSTLIKTILGIGDVNITKGKIYFEGRDISNMDPYKRAQIGISAAFQYPPSFDGLKAYEFIEAMRRKYNVPNLDIDLHIESLLRRDLFKNFSGGEKKKLEIYIALLQNPKLLLLDEPDSGVDVENIQYIAKSVDWAVDNGISVLLVTHQGFILNHIKNEITKAHVMVNGSIAFSGDPKIVIDTILKNGYKKGVELIINLK